MLGDAQTGLFVARHALALAGQRHQAIQRTAIEQMPAKLIGDPPGDGAFPRAARSVDGDDGDSSVTCHPLGKRISTRAHNAGEIRERGRDIRDVMDRIGAAARKLATENDMAIRWSPWLSTVPPENTAAPAALNANAVGQSLRRSTPSAIKPSAITAMRSLSFTRNSSAPRHDRLALGARGGHEQHREFVDRQRHQSSGT